jgi:hypothetical protein
MATPIFFFYSACGAEAEAAEIDVERAGIVGADRR